jgi:hypothetical protein
MSEQALPEELVGRLNELGFALTGGGEAYTFLRALIDGEIRVSVKAVGEDRWRVGVAPRSPELPGWRVDPVLPFPLEAAGPHADDTVLELTKAELIEDLPRLLRESVLPVWDRGSPYRRGE